MFLETTTNRFHSHLKKPVFSPGWVRRKRDSPRGKRLALHAGALWWASGHLPEVVERDRRQLARWELAVGGVGGGWWVGGGGVRRRAPHWSCVVLLHAGKMSHDDFERRWL